MNKTRFIELGRCISEDHISPDIECLTIVSKEDYLIKPKSFALIGNRIHSVIGNIAEVDKSSQGDFRVKNNLLFKGVWNFGSKKWLRDIISEEDGDSILFIRIGKGSNHIDIEYEVLKRNDKCSVIDIYIDESSSERLTFLVESELHRFIEIHGRPSCVFIDGVFLDEWLVNSKDFFCKCLSDEIELLAYNHNVSVKMMIPVLNSGPLINDEHFRRKIDDNIFTPNSSDEEYFSRKLRLFELDYMELLDSEVFEYSESYGYYVPLNTENSEH